MKTIILSLLSLVFLSGCHGYTELLVEADEYPINQDLLGTWLHPQEEEERVQPIKFYKFSDTEYLVNDDNRRFYRAYEIEFREKKYLQVETLYPRKEKEGDGLDFVTNPNETDNILEIIHDTSDKYRFNIFKYTLSGDNLTLSILGPSLKIRPPPIEEYQKNPANDIQGEGVFFEFPTLKRQIDK